MDTREIGDADWVSLHGFNPRSPRRGPETIYGPAGVGEITLFVDYTAPSGGDGSSWATAYQDLQQALADANNEPAITAIHVAEGIYTPDSGTGDRSAEFLLVGRSDLELLGGFPEGGSDPADRDPAEFETVLSGDLDGNDDVTFINLLFDSNSNPINTAVAGLMYQGVEENSFTVFGASGSTETLVIDGFTITGGHDPDRGGGLMAAFASLTLRNLTFHANSGGFNGGAIFFTDPALPVTLESCSFAFNSATEEGGAVYVERGSLEIIGGDYAQNVANKGGAIAVLDIDSDNYELSVRDATFERNLATIREGSANSFGGAVYTEGAVDSIIEDVSFIENKSALEGGAVHIGENAVLSRVDFIGNQCGDDAGAAWVGQNATVEDCVFDGNEAERLGGGLRIEDNSLVARCTFIENDGGTGGSLFMDDNNEIKDSIFTGNVAGNGGGLYVSSGNAISGCSFSSNFSTSRGGGLYVEALATVRDCGFDDNIANSQGGGVYTGSNVNFWDCVVRRNISSSFGGGIYTGDSSNLTRVVFEQNLSAADGGGLYGARRNEVNGSSFVGNIAGSDGGGAAFDDQSTITDCLFENNSSVNTGGGLWLDNDNVVAMCRFVNNRTDGSGGGLHIRLRNEIGLAEFIGNTAGTTGGGINILDDENLVFSVLCSGNVAETGGGIASTDLQNHIINATVVANSANSVGGVYADTVLSITNSILWGNTDETSGVERQQLGGEFHLVKFTLIEGLADYFGSSNFGDNPQFIDEDGPDNIPGSGDDNLRLLGISPAIDVGDNLAASGLASTDLDGNPRFSAFNSIFPTIDLGAYEVTDCDGNGRPDGTDIHDGLVPDCDENGVPDSCDPDCNSNGIPDVCDLEAFPGLFDCNGDGMIDGCERNIEDFHDEITENAAEINELVPNLFNFSGGETGTSIADGGADMYDGGNFLATNLQSQISYTNGLAIPGTSAFGPDSRYLTSKIPGIFVLVVEDMSISHFEINGGLGADGSGTFDSFEINVLNGAYRGFVKRVYDTSDASVNHVILVPSIAGGAKQLLPDTTNSDFHRIDGLEPASQLVFILTSRRTNIGLPLEEQDAVALAEAVLNLLGAPDSDGDGIPDTCEINGCNQADLAEPIGVLDIDDILAFLDAFTSVTYQADLAEPKGLLDLLDIVRFIDAFFEPCP